MTFKIGYCAGHGYYTAGKRTPDDEREWMFNDKVVRAFEEAMKQYEGVELRRFDDPTGKTDVSLKTRTDGANAWGADIYISFHHNAAKGTWGNWTGIETFTFEGSNPQSEKLASCIHPEMVNAYELKDRGMKKENLHIVRETHMPSVLVEGGYMDSVIDIKKLRDDNVLRNAGIGVANGVANYANLKLKPIPVKSAEVKQEQKGDDDKLNIAGTVKTQMVASLAKMCDKNVHGDNALSSIWVDKLKKDEMTISEAVALFYIGKDRGLF